MTTPNTPYQAERQILSVSALNRLAKVHLEQGFSLMWIEGEISNFARPASGHWYFSLKDRSAQVQCIMFRNRNMLVKETPKNGQHVLIRARVTLYEARGNFQLNVEHLEDAGEGALKIAFEQLKNKLDAEGLFAQERKKPLPDTVRSIGVITSPTGAAVKDVLTVLNKRSPLTQVVVYPAQVQGESAAQTLVDAIKTANERNEVDVILLTRGGGSLEDLWPFNEEIVARAVADSNTPIVSAVGHEVDFTIADLVADQRAATPSQGAELLSHDRQVTLRQLTNTESRLLQLFQQQLFARNQRLDIASEKLLRHSPQSQIRLQRQRWQNINARLLPTLPARLGQQRERLQNLSHRLQQCIPSKHIANQQQQVSLLNRRLQQQMKLLLDNRTQRLSYLANSLDQLSPLATLGRGYSITRSEKGKIVNSIKQVKPGQTLTSEVNDGVIESQVISASKKI